MEEKKDAQFNKLVVLKTFCSTTIEEQVVQNSLEKVNHPPTRVYTLPTWTGPDYW